MEISLSAGTLSLIGSDARTYWIEGDPVLPGINHDVVAFVMARWQESGGFGFAPTLPASVEDTYHALRILETIQPVSEREFQELKGNPDLKAFLLRKEDKETWPLKTAYQYLFLCRLCGLRPNQGWLRRSLRKRPKQVVSLRDRHYLARIRREFLDAAFMDYGRILDGGRPDTWRTAKELWMGLYLHEGSPEALHSTKKELINWLQACQTQDGGFGGLPGTTSFIENTHWCLRALALLGGVPLRRDMARDFILWCKTRGGGFARKNGAAPLLCATWHAVAGLSLLRIMSEGPCPTALPVPARPGQGPDWRLRKV